MDGPLVEGRHLKGAKLGADDAAVAIGIENAVFGDHLRDQAALNDDLELGRSGVDVQGVHAAGLDTTDGHAGAGADKGGEIATVGGDELAPLTGASLLLVKVENEVFVVG